MDFVFMLWIEQKLFFIIKSKIKRKMRHVEFIGAYIIDKSTTVSSYHHANNIFVMINFDKCNLDIITLILNQPKKPKATLPTIMCVLCYLKIVLLRKRRRRRRRNVSPPNSLIIKVTTFTSQKFSSEKINNKIKITALLIEQ